MSTPRPIVADYLWVQTAIAQRIAEQLPELDPAPVDDMAALLEANLSSPRAFVAWAGEQIADDARAGASVISRQQYTVLLLVRHAQQTDRAKRNLLAGPLLARLHGALAGHTPEGASRPLKRVTGARPNYGLAVGTYPLTFEIQLTL